MRLPGAIFTKSDGDLLSPIQKIPPSDAFVVTCNIPEALPGGVAWPRFDLDLRVGTGRGTTPFQTMLQFDGSRFRSKRGKPSDYCKVDVDTLVLTGGVRGGTFQVRIRYDSPGAVVPPVSVGVSYYLSKTPGEFVKKPLAAAAGVVLDVHERSQGVEDPAISSRICSPTATSMALAFLGAPIPTASFAKMVYDDASDLYGNWSINASVAGRVIGEAFAIHMSTFEELEREIATGRPVVLSHAWKEGELSNSPIPKTAGHLILVVGVTNEGDLIVNDPAAKPSTVRRVYKREEIHRTWQQNASGVVYIFRPK